MKKRFLALLLAALLLATLLPSRADWLGEDEHGNTAFVSLKKADRDGATYYFTYYWNGNLYSSLDVGPAMNYKAFSMMSDSDKRKVAKNFAWSREKRDATFGAEKGTVVWRYHHEATGWGPAARKYLSRIEKCNTDPVLLQRFSTAHTDPATGKTWFQKTMDEEFTAGEELTELYKYDYATVNVIFMKEYIRRAQTSMKTGQTYYARLVNYEKLAIEAATKGISKELIKIITDKVLVPALVPGTKYCSEIAEAAWEFGQELWGIYMDASGCQQNLETMLYGDSLDPAQVISEANTMSEMLINGCNRCYQNAKADWTRAEQLAVEIRKEVAQYNAERDAARARIAAAKEKAKDENIVAATVITQETESAAVAVSNPNPGEFPADSMNNVTFSDTTSEAYREWHEPRQRYRDHVVNAYRNWAALKAPIQQHYTDFMTRWKAYVATWQNTLDDVVGDTPPAINSSFDVDEWDRIRLMKDPTPAEMSLHLTQAGYVEQYYGEVIEYAKRREARVKTVLEQETQTIADFKAEWLDIRCAVEAWRGANPDLLQTGKYERKQFWEAEDSKADYDAIKAYCAWDSTNYPLGDDWIYLANSIELPEGATGLQNQFTLPAKDPLRYGYNGSYLSALLGYEGMSNGQYARSKSYSVGGWGSYLDALEGQMVDKGEIISYVEGKLEEVSRTTAAQKTSHDQLMRELRSHALNYGTARDNYELARKAYIKAAEDDKALIKSLPNYVKEQYVVGEDNIYSNLYKYLETGYYTTYDRSKNPAMYDLLVGTDNRPMLVGQIKTNLQSLWRRHDQNQGKMDNAYAAMEAAAEIMRAEWNNHLTHYALDEQGHNLNLDYNIPFPYSSIWDDNREYTGYIVDPKKVKSDVIPFSRGEQADIVALEMLNKDFSGVGRVQAVADECIQLLKTNRSKILREGVSNAPYSSYSPTLDSIYNRYNTAIQTVCADSWAGLRNSYNGLSDTDFINAWYALKQQVDGFYTSYHTTGSAGRVAVTGISKGGTRASLLDTEPEYDLTLTENAAGVLHAVLAPENATEKTIVWETTDSTVATVDGEGRVTAHAAGDVTIRAYPLDSDAVPIDQDGEVMTTATGADFGAPVESTGQFFSGYTYVLNDVTAGTSQSAVLEYTVHVTPRERQPLELTDETGAVLDAIPQGSFRVSLQTDLDADTAAETVLAGAYLAAYDSSHRFLSLQRTDAAVDQGSVTVRAEFEVDNGGDIASLKVFILDVFGRCTPLRGALELPAGSQAG